jgi:hypothetical protein
MGRHFLFAAAALALLAGCSSGSGPAPVTAGQPTATTPSAQADNRACDAGLKGTEPGVIRISCDGPAEVRIQAGAVTKDLHGGRCQSAAGIWGVAVGVIIDETGTQGKYDGPPVTGITINNTSTPGKATIQADLDGKQYFDLGDATLTLSGEGATAHVAGVSDPLSDAPGAKITVDVTC